MNPAMPAASGDRGDQLADEQEDAVAAEGADQRHVDDVEPERRQATVGEQQRLDDEHHGDGEGAGVRPDEHGGEDAAHQVTARAVGDGEVEHLGGEDEGGDEPDDGDVPLVQRLRRPSQAERHAGDGDETGHQRRGPVEEPIRNVHREHLASDPLRTINATQSQIKFVCEPTRRLAVVDPPMTTGEARTTGIGAGAAAADDGEVGAVEDEVVVAFEALAEGGERLGRHGDVAPADLAHQVAHLVGRRALVQRRAVGEVHVAHGADLLEQPQRAVHRGHVHVGHVGGQLVGGERPAAAAHGIDDGGPGPPDAVAGRTQLVDDVVRRDEPRRSGVADVVTARSACERSSASGSGTTAASER